MRKPCLRRLVRKALPSTSRIILASAAIITVGGCAAATATVTVTQTTPPPSEGSAACSQIQAMNLPSVANAVDSANDFGATPPNGAIQLTRAQMAAMRADGKTLRR
jgi:hypothetical protein